MKISVSPNATQITYLANCLASDVVGFTAKRFSELADEDNNDILHNLDDKETLEFMQALLETVHDAYVLQIRSLKRKINNDKEKVQTC